MRQTEITNDCKMFKEYNNRYLTHIIIKCSHQFIRNLVRLDYNLNVNT